MYKYLSSKGVLWSVAINIVCVRLCVCVLQGVGRDG